MQFSEGFGELRGIYRATIARQAASPGVVAGPEYAHGSASVFLQPDLLWFSNRRRFRMKDFLRLNDSVFLDCAFVGLLRRPVDPAAGAMFRREIYPTSYRIWVVLTLFSYEERKSRGVKLANIWFWRKIHRYTPALYPVVTRLRALRQRSAPG